MESLTNFKSLGIMAIFAGVASAWSQVKSFFVRFKSIFIVTVKLNDNTLKKAVDGYLREEYKKSKIGSLTFGSNTVFLNTLKKRVHIGFILPSEAMTFWDGFKPLFVGQAIDSDRGNDTITFTFIRGTFDAREIIIKSLDRWNKIKSSEDDSNVRFRVVDYYGSFSRGDGEDKITERNEEVEIETTEWKNYELLNVDLKDIGQEKLDDPFCNLYYDQHVNDFIKELDRWIESKEWFDIRGLDWRMGVLLKGFPGTGKSSFAKAVAQKYNLPIYRFDLISMSNEELNRYWNRALSNSPCIALLEDLDRLYNEKGEMINSDTMQTKGKLTTDAILNCISGVSDSNGVLTIVTANHPEKLPDALTRAGRLDIDLELGYMTEEGKRSMATKILTGEHQTVKDAQILKEINWLLDTHPEVTGATFQRACTKYSLDKYWGRVSDSIQQEMASIH